MALAQGLEPTARNRPEDQNPQSTLSTLETMSGAILALHICTFLAWTGGVAATTWFILRNFMRHSSSATEDHFAGGRSLKWYVCAGSLMLTNLSTEQLVGLNGAVFADGCLAGIWWEAGAAIAMIATATVFLPKYFALGLTATTGFLGERYDLTMRTMVSVLFLIYYSLVLCLWCSTPERLPSGTYSTSMCLSGL